MILIVIIILELAGLGGVVYWKFFSWYKLFSLVKWNRGKSSLKRNTVITWLNERKYNFIRSPIRKLNFHVIKSTLNNQHDSCVVIKQNQYGRPEFNMLWLYHALQSSLFNWGLDQICCTLFYCGCHCSLLFKWW